MLDPAIEAHYEQGIEQRRLAAEASLEWVRTQELLKRYLPPAPAQVLDLGGGPGNYAAWLAQLGYAVRLVDRVARHIAEAQALANSQPDHSFTAVLGDARQLAEPDGAYDAVLLMGPLYHLVDRRDRVQALREAGRVVRPGGRILAVVISRFASLLDGLRSGNLANTVFRAIVETDLHTGQHRNPEPERRPEWFTTAYFHRPEELPAEVHDAGVELEVVLGIEGPGWLLWRSVWDDPIARANLVDVARAVETEPSALGAGSHLVAVVRKRGESRRPGGD
jgi:SAM-dependent methyltransferase